MARKPKEAVRETGLYKNGSRWWLRVKSPVSGVMKPLSAGTDDLALANNVKQMVAAFYEDRPMYEWLDRAVKGEVKLLDLYNRQRRGELTAFAAELVAARTSDEDADLDALVQRWIDDDLDTRADCRPLTKANYARQVRYFIPTGVPFPRSLFTEQYVRERTKALTGSRARKTGKVLGGTQRNYLVALQQFVHYGERAGVLTVNPLRFAFGKHGWAAKRRTRAVYWEYPRVRTVLDHVSDPEAKAALAMIFGSGLELGGLLNQKRSHFGERLPDGRGKIVVPGQDSSLTKSDRKNDFRSERTIFVDAWAWKIVEPYVTSRAMLPKAALWSYSGSDGKALRDTFYHAQVAAGLLEAPERTASRKLAWASVSPHTLHDARHSYCINRSLGLDGEPPRSAGFCARQLGHASEQMVISIYKKANIEDQVRTLELAQAMQEARAAAAGGAR